jgi:hypothetical protein
VLNDIIVALIGCFGVILSALIARRSQSPLAYAILVGGALVIGCSLYTYFRFAKVCGYITAYIDPSPNREEYLRSKGVIRNAESMKYFENVRRECIWSRAPEIPSY